MAFESFAASFELYFLCVLEIVALNFFFYRIPSEGSQESRHFTTRRRCEPSGSFTQAHHVYNGQLLAYSSSFIIFEFYILGCSSCHCNQSIFSMFYSSLCKIGRLHPKCIINYNFFGLLQHSVSLCVFTGAAAAARSGIG